MVVVGVRDTKRSRFRRLWLANYLFCHSVSFSALGLLELILVEFIYFRVTFHFGSRLRVILQPEVLQLILVVPCVIVNKAKLINFLFIYFLFLRVPS